jgi:hypothetical protein
MKQFLVVAVFAMFAATPSYACTCAEEEGSLGKQVKRAHTNSQLVFTGTVVGRRVSNTPSDSFLGEPIVYRFEIDTTYKGVPTSEIIEVASEALGSGCGYEFQVGMSYLVYARKASFSSTASAADFNFETSLCSRNQPLASVHKKEFKKLRRMRN